MVFSQCVPVRGVTPLRWYGAFIPLAFLLCACVVLWYGVGQTSHRPGQARRVVLVADELGRERDRVRPHQERRRAAGLRRERAMLLSCLFLSCRCFVFLFVLVLRCQRLVAQQQIADGRFIAVAAGSVPGLFVPVQYCLVVRALYAIREG